MRSFTATRLPQDILFKGAVEIAASARALDAALMKYSPNGGELFTPKWPAQNSPRTAKPSKVDTSYPSDPFQSLFDLIPTHSA